MNQQKILEEALVLVPEGDEEGPHDIAIEKMGTPAFDWLQRQLRNTGLPSSQRVRAMALMSRISRQFCVERKGELLDDAMGVALDESSSVELRSAGIKVALVNVHVAAGLRNAAECFGGRDAVAVRREVHALALQARTQQISDEVRSSVARFLARGGGSEDPGA